MTGADLERRLGGAGPPVVVVDVRSRVEFTSGHVPGAIHVPFWQMPFRFHRVPKGPRPVVVYCGHGPRAQWAAVWLRRAGHAQVEYLDGHMARWHAERRPLERGPAKR